MIAYFDTSSVIPLLVEEPSSATCARLWDTASRVVSSRVLYVEARAALAQAARRERLSARALRQAVADLDRTVDQIDHVEVTEQLVRDAGALAQSHGLRGYDALHLAAATSIADEQTIFVAGDATLVDAAQALRLATART